MERARIQIYKTKQPVVDEHCEIAEKAATLGEPLNLIRLPETSDIAPTEYSLPIGYQEVLVQPLTYTTPDKQLPSIRLGNMVVPTICSVERCNSCILDKVPNGLGIIATIAAEAEVPIHGSKIEYEL